MKVNAEFDIASRIFEASINLETISPILRDPKKFIGNPRTC